MVYETIKHNGALKLAPVSDNKKNKPVFSKRELDILLDLAKNMTRKEIAKKRFISEYTVGRHITNMQQKTDSHTVLSLVIYSIRNKILIPGDFE